MWRKKGPGAPTAGVDRDIWKSSGYGRPGGRMDVDQRTDGWTGRGGQRLGPPCPDAPCCQSRSWNNGESDGTSA